MSDKTKISTAKTINTKRPSTVSGASSSRTKINSKDAKITPRTKKVDADVTISNKEQHGFPDFDAEYRQIAYGKLLRGLLEECIVTDKIEREETIVDLQMAQLADRFKKTMDQLDKTSRRLKDISFVVEQKRLLDLKNKDCTQFYDATEQSNATELLQNLSSAEQTCLDRIELNNVNFGYMKDTGHQQLLNAVNDAIEGLNTIKKDSNLDANKFKDYEASKSNITELEKDRFDFESLKSEFETTFPMFSENLLKEASEKIAKMIDGDEETDD